MSDGIRMILGEDGVAREYDDTYDITIHCETEEEREKAIDRINDSIPCGYIRAKARNATGAESTYLRKLITDWEKEHTEGEDDSTGQTDA